MARQCLYGMQLIQGSTKAMAATKASIMAQCSWGQLYSSCHSLATHASRFTTAEAWRSKITGNTHWHSPHNSNEGQLRIPSWSGFVEHNLLDIRVWGCVFTRSRGVVVFPFVVCWRLCCGLNVSYVWFCLVCTIKRSFNKVSDIVAQKQSAPSFHDFHK